MSRIAESLASLDGALALILAEAAPAPAVEVSLGEALGLVLAEAVVADVDQPPFDRAAVGGYAVRAAEVAPGALLRVVRPGADGQGPDDPAHVEAGEAGRVRAGDPLPPGTDAVLRPRAVRPDGDAGAGAGPIRVVEVLDAPEAGRGVTPRGAHLAAGATVAPAGTRVTPALVPILAAQGCVHPLCHRRARVAIVAVGDHWVAPAEAPTMNRERNAANAALVALTLRAEAMPHDFGVVAPAQARTALERATTAPVVVVLGPAARPLARAWRALGFEPVVDRIAIAGIGRARYGVIRDEDGRVANHVFHLPGRPDAALAAFALLVRPLIDRLQGATPGPPRATGRPADGADLPATRRRPRVRPATTCRAPDGRRVAEPIPGPADDLPSWARADGLLVLPAHAGPWGPGDAVEFVPLD